MGKWPSHLPNTLTEPGQYYLWVQAQDAAGNTSLWAKAFTYRYDTHATVTLYVPDAPGLVYTASWSEDVASPIDHYNVKYLLPSGQWQTILSNTRHTRVELMGNAGENANQVCVQGVDEQGIPGEWTCSPAFTTTAKATRYYAFGSQTVAMRVEDAQAPTQSQVYYLTGDQVNSTSLVTDSQGQVVAQNRYTAFGQVRLEDGALPTDRTYTGQRDDGMGLMDYNARYYDPALGRFVSPDSIIPQLYNPQAWDRYAYVTNNPVNYVDPSGHMVCEDPDNKSTCAGKDFNSHDYILNHNKWERLDPAQIPNPEGRPLKVLESSISYYNSIRTKLFLRYGWDYVNGLTGQVEDTALMAMMIKGEFGSHQGESVYYEALEGLSNQYHSTSHTSNIQCGGSCSMAEQIAWLSDYEAWYRGSINNQGLYKPEIFGSVYGDAQLAASGYSIGINSSWFWGDVTEDELRNYPEPTAKTRSRYPGKMWFIVYPAP